MADERDIEKLAREVESLRNAMKELMRSFELASQLAQNYIKLINIYAQYGGLGIDVMIPQIKHDPIAREIVKILFDKKSANISQITRELKARRGKASRNTVREKLNRLVELGAVVEIENEHSKEYILNKDVISKWLELIGIPINLEQI